MKNQQNIAYARGMMSRIVVHLLASVINIVNNENNIPDKIKKKTVQSNTNFGIIFEMITH